MNDSLSGERRDRSASGEIVNKNLYNSSSELNITSNWYETMFREYDPVLGRMNGVDMMASEYGSISPYNYAFNKPISFSDPSGADPVTRSNDNNTRDGKSIIKDYNNTAGNGGDVGGSFDESGTFSGSGNTAFDALVNQAWSAAGNAAGDFGGAVSMWSSSSPNEITVYSSNSSEGTWMPEFTYNYKEYTDGVKGPAYNIRLTGITNMAAPVLKTDENGSLDFGSPNKITGAYSFVSTGNGWTGQVTGLGFDAMNTKTKQVITVQFPVVCLTIKPLGNNTQVNASLAFLESWNQMTDRLDAWLNAQGSDTMVTDSQLRSQALFLFSSSLRENTLYGAFSLGPCVGNVPTTEAMYSWWDTLFK